LTESPAKEQFYVINYQPHEEGLCRMEMKYLFNEEIRGKYFFSGEKIKPSRSPFIRNSLSVMYRSDTLEGLADQLRENKAAYDGFKFAHFRIDDGELGYREWIGSVTILGAAIDGDVDMVNPRTMLGATKVHGKWIMGEYEKNDNQWFAHDKKPVTSSHSLCLSTAKALVNIAVGDKPGCTLVDPCCGVGTVVIEALSMDVDVKGFEINRQTAGNAKRNLAFFGFENVITTGDMHKIEEHFDAAILDIPYGIFTPITPGQQREIIYAARRIADKLVIVTFEDMDETIRSAGFTIVDHCHVYKGRFKRFIRVCR
jgi:tRNA (guanine10-N2)-dimethyltransferase